MALNRRRQPDPDRERYDEHPDLFMRDMVEWVKESCPKDYMLFLRAIGCGKMDESYGEGEFCVVSAFQDGSPKEENLQRQFILAEEMRCAGFGFVPHTGFWDNLSHRCLFVPCLTKNDCRSLCQKYDLPCYVHGTAGSWKSYSTKSNEVLAAGDTMKYIDFDEPFLIYYKINRKKFAMVTEIQGLVDKKGRLTRDEKNILKVTARQLDDLEQLEREVMEKQL